ncbi:hypothetical protein PVK06_020287 [Gossypium arboreum]|uniref:Uncharacterized protein n=1 Tax=Gossypium arboreum TaxID=29729 RepID=A0ABR0PMM2_GOSAR|nr:hypothetical protein PVK06_020287 [Gossypium arboreum]
MFSLFVFGAIWLYLLPNLGPVDLGINIEVCGGSGNIDEGINTEVGGAKSEETGADNDEGDRVVGDDFLGKDIENVHEGKVDGHESEYMDSLDPREDRDNEKSDD